LIVALQVDGSAKGWIYLTGTPTYNSQDSTIRVPDLDFDLNTKNILADVANWLLHPQFVSALRAKIGLPIGNRLTQVKDMIESGLNRDVIPGIRLHGSVTAISIIELFPVRTGMEIRANLQATVGADIVKVP
jgi:hypothetical protein